MPKNGYPQVADKIIMNRGKDPCCRGSKRGRTYLSMAKSWSVYVPMIYKFTGEYGGGMWPKIVDVTVK